MPELPRFDRRRFLGAVAGLAGLSGGAAVLGGCSSSPKATDSSNPGASTGPSRSTTTTTQAVRIGRYGLPIASWVVEENARRGTTEWLRRETPAGGVEGFLDQVSAVAGDELTLYVNTTGRSVAVAVFRMGWYQGRGARLVTRLGTHTGRVQQAPKFTPGINMVECHWQPTLRFAVGHDWPTGYYLLHLVSDNGWAQWVPLVVRDDASTAAVLVQSSVTTWQAYNDYGGYSLYFGESGTGATYANRSRVVSFDRPYPGSQENGTSDFFGGEYPLVALVERLGVDVTYWTDIDLHQRARLLSKHRCLVSLGHDEYWSSAMRSGAQQSLDSGLNFAFLGANACYRHIRLDSSPLGPDRHQVCYKDPTEDPLYGKDNAEVTANWPDGPVPKPESALIGIEYQAFGGSGDLVVVDPDPVFFAGTGLGSGSRITGVLGSEFDRYVPTAPSPADVQLLCHSPTPSVIGTSYSDMSYYTTKNGGGVFASGTASYVNRLWANPGLLPKPFAPGPTPGATAPLERLTTNLLALFSKGPASAHHPSRANWRRWYTPGAGGPPPAAA